MRQVTNIVATVVAMVSIGAVVTAAYGETSNVFDNHPPSGWKTPALSATCQRGEVTIHFGRTVKSVRIGTIEGFAVDDSELKCVTRHEILIGLCAAKAPLASQVPTVTVYRKDDWKAGNLAAASQGVDKPGSDGVDALRASLVQTDKALNCIARASGVK